MLSFLLILHADFSTNLARFLLFTLGTAWGRYDNLAENGPRGIGYGHGIPHGIIEAFMGVHMEPSEYQQIQFVPRFSRVNQIVQRIAKRLNIKTKHRRGPRPRTGPGQSLFQFHRPIYHDAFTQTALDLGVGRGVPVQRSSWCLSLVLRVIIFSTPHVLVLGGVQHPEAACGILKSDCTWSRLWLRISFSTGQHQQYLNWLCRPAIYWPDFFKLFYSKSTRKNARYRPILQASAVQ